MFWVITEICSESNLVKRMKIMKTFIKIASKFVSRCVFMRSSSTHSSALLVNTKLVWPSAGGILVTNIRVCLFFNSVKFCDIYLHKAYALFFSMTYFNIRAVLIVIPLMRGLALFLFKPYSVSFICLFIYRTL